MKIIGSLTLNQCTVAITCIHLEHCNTQSKLQIATCCPLHLYQRSSSDPSVWGIGFHLLGLRVVETSSYRKAALMISTSRGNCSGCLHMKNVWVGPEISANRQRSSFLPNTVLKALASRKRLHFFLARCQVYFLPPCFKNGCKLGVAPVHAVKRTPLML